MLTIRYYIEGITSFHEYKYENRTIMLFGEIHNGSGCMNVRNKIPFIDIVQELIESSDVMVDVFIEAPEIKNYGDDPNATSLGAILSLKHDEWKQRARFHWVDIRYIKHSSFLEVLSEPRQFLSAERPERDIPKLETFIKWHIEPLTNEKHPMMDAIFQSAKINKQLQKIEPKQAERIRTFFQAAIRKQAKEFMSRNWPTRMKEAFDIDSTPNYAVKRNQFLKQHFGLTSCPFDREGLVLRTSQCLLLIMRRQASDIAMTFMNAYVLARLLKPYVQNAIIIVGNAHVPDFKRFFQSFGGQLGKEGRRAHEGYINCVEMNNNIEF